MNTWRKQLLSWRCGSTLYLSVPFTWLMAEAEALAAKHNGPVIAGGPAVKLMGAPWADETPNSCPFNVLAMHNPCAMFTTRGCPRSCSFCAVPRIEGRFRELPNWKPAPIVCDNNILEASHQHFERVIDSLLHFPHVDFNQGLDARLFTRWHAEELARLQSVKVRFALDDSRLDGTVADAIDRARSVGLRDFGVYVLIGFRDTPEDALHRLELVRSLGIRPNPMRYQPLDATAKNSHVAEAWTERELRRMVRYYSKLRWLEHIPFADYDPDAAELFRQEETLTPPPPRDGSAVVAQGGRHA